MVKRFEPEDPLELKGVEVPAGDAEHQARVIMEEYFMMGMPRDEVLNLFENPFFSWTHSLFQRLGRKKVETILDETWKPANR